VLITDVIGPSSLSKSPYWINNEVLAYHEYISAIGGVQGSHSLKTQQTSRHKLYPEMVQ
jgi:hypothetical protein